MVNKGSSFADFVGFYPHTPHLLIFINSSLIKETLIKKKYSINEFFLKTVQHYNLKRNTEFKKSNVKTIDYVTKIVTLLGPRKLCQTTLKKAANSINLNLNMKVWKIENFSSMTEFLKKF